MKKLGMQNFSLTQLRYFCAVASTGSLAAAGAQLHVSATAIGAAIDALEQAFEAQLCIRQKSRGVRLTPTGRQLHEEAMAILSAAEHLSTRIRATDAEMSGELTVGCFTNLAPLVVPQMLKVFGDRFPKVELKFEIHLNAVLLDGVRSGEIDCVVTYQNLVPDSHDSLPLLDTAVYVLVHPEHRLATRRTLSVADLRDEPMILFQSPEASGGLIPTFGRQPLDFQIRFRSSQMDLVHAMVAHGLGFTLTRRPRSGVDRRAGLNVAIPLAVDWPSDPICIAWSKAVRPYPQLTEFITLAQSLAEKNLLVDQH